MPSLKWSVLALAISPTLYANPMEITGTIQQSVPINNHQAVQSRTQEITLLHYRVKDEDLSNLRQRKRQLNRSNMHYAYADLPKRVQLGMNGVPVLDQGRHGSCVTFASTGAIDALLGQDYVSQLCSLQLGNHLETNGYLYSGWHGSFGELVLNQLTQFGVVSKEKEKTQGCGGLTDYPHNAPDPESEMPLEDYHALSENLEEQGFYHYPLLSPFQAFQEKIDTIKTLEQVKKTLSLGDRVVFGTTLVHFDEGVAGAVGRFHKANDTWVLTPEIARDAYLIGDLGGHEMIITGYDDEAIARDSAGRTHKGLLTIRNSWGDAVGNKGDFYMTYDYFILFVNEAHRVGMNK